MAQLDTKLYGGWTMWQWYYEVDITSSLLHATDKTCGWMQGLGRHEATWSWDYDVDMWQYKNQKRLFKAWKKGDDKEDIPGG